jgi:hypothetical protein
MKNKAKRLVALVLVALAFALAGCDPDGDGNGDNPADIICRIAANDPSTSPGPMCNFAK